MEILLNTSNPVIILIYTLIIAFLIFVARKSEIRAVMIVPLALIIGLLIYHSLALDGFHSSEQEMISQTYHCLAADLIWLLITFFSYLWVDDIVAKKKKLKSYDDSLSWFWNKI